MPYDPRSINPTGDMYQLASPGTLGTIKKGLGGAIGGVVTGASAGMMLGGVAGVGMAGGALGGAALGAGFGLLLAVSKRLIKQWEDLAMWSKRIIAQYAKFDPTLRSLNRQWKRLDRDMNRLWAKTLRPAMEKWGKWGMKFQKAWMNVKIEWHKAIAPLIDILFNLLQTFMPLILGIATVLAKLVSGIAILIKFLWTLPDTIGKVTGMSENMRTGAIWGAIGGTIVPGVGTIFGAIAGAIGGVVLDLLQGKLFGGGKAGGGDVGAGIEYVIGEQGPETFIPKVAGTIVPSANAGNKPADLGGIHVSVNVSDSTALAQRFSTAWDQTRSELRQLEAANMVTEVALAAQGAYA